MEDSYSSHDNDDNGNERKEGNRERTADRTDEETSEYECDYYEQEYIDKLITERREKIVLLATVLRDYFRNLCLPIFNKKSSLSIFVENVEALF